jgi:hypothetical protein
MLQLANDASDHGMEIHRFSFILGQARRSFDEAEELFLYRWTWVALGSDTVRGPDLRTVKLIWGCSHMVIGQGI